ncbi:uncharacterized protein [Oscarella lobularis]|uniref:uncharacterized protein n=1 Tax=Oscarella lobularis TaxID=121494 RepID=UPI00331446B2
MYVKIETDRLNFVRYNQKELRAETYSNFADALLTDNADPRDVGQKVVLPSSFSGGPRYMHQRTQDAMSYVRKFGKPSLFITMTGNPKWPEIQQELFHRQQANDRPDIVARVFHLKKEAFSNVLTKECIFGKVSAHVSTIEWQKRGLPHAHILLWLASPLMPGEIDAIISAEIPNKDSNLRLHDIVVTNMMHGPCGETNLSCSCMEDNRCKKDFPKDFSQETVCGNDGYPLYRRRSPGQGGHTCTKIVNGRTVVIDNRWVVPYSPYLCDAFNCHLNVEVCNSIRVIQYVIKYLMKGCDMASFVLQGISPNDEVSLYQAARYISCSEACWRIFGFSIHDRYPSVVQLQVHLPNGQRVLFTEENASEIAASPPNTTLTAYFKLCLKYQSADNEVRSADEEFIQHLPYISVSEYFIFENTTKTWKPRKTGKSVQLPDGRLTNFKQSAVIGRIHAVSPKQTECFYVRLLLHHRFNCTSFLDLRTVNGQVKDTFRDACLAHGLLQDDSHWRRCMEEASVSASPYSMRHLFAVLLTSCNPSEPLKLWDANNG